MPNYLLRKKNIIVFGAIVASTIIAVWAAFCFLSGQPEKNYNADIIIENATILTLNNKSEIIENGWIAIKNGVIIGLGSGSRDYIPKETIDGKNKIVMPGLVNTHSHAAMTILRGVDDSSKLPEWLKNVNIYESGLTRDDVYWGAMFGEIEMIKSGTTTFNDMYFFEESTAKSVKDTGTRGMIDAPLFLKKENNEVEIDQKFIDGNKNVPAIKISLSPNPLINFSKNELETISKKAIENDLAIHIHIEEDSDEKNKFIEKYNLTPLELITSTGLIKNKIIMAHGTNFTGGEIEFLSKYPNVGISFNPKSNFKLSGSTAPILKMMDYNLNIGIGTDGAASSNSLDMFDQMNFIAFAVGKCDSGQSYCENKNNIYPEKIIRMATIEGAKVLGMEKEIGSLEIGKKADIILIDFKGAGHTPPYNAYSSLVYNTDGSDVSDSIIDGKIIMRDRKLLNIDEKKVIDKVNDISKEIKNRNRL